MVAEFEEETEFVNGIQTDLNQLQNKKILYKNFKAKYLKDIQDDLKEDIIEEKKEEDLEKKRKAEQLIADEREVQEFIQENLLTHGSFEASHIELIGLVDQNKM